jgi:hypothetical protein
MLGQEPASPLSRQAEIAGSRRTLPRAWLGIALILVAAGCASSPQRPGQPPTAGDFDPQLLIGRWQGQWQAALRSGPAYLDIRDVQGRAVSGRLYVENYGSMFGGTEGEPLEFTGSLSEYGNRLRLAIAGGSEQFELVIVGTVMRGTLNFGATPSSTTTFTLQQTSGWGPPPK